MTTNTDIPLRMTRTTYELWRCDRAGGWVQIGYYIALSDAISRASDYTTPTRIVHVTRALMENTR